MCISRSFRSFMSAVALFMGSFSPVLAYDGIATPLVAEVGVPIQIDPTDGFRAEPSQQLKVVWTWESIPSGSMATFDDPDVYRPTFTPDFAGSYHALATFYDRWDTGNTTPLNTVRIEIGTGNLTPIAKIRPRGMPNGSSPLVMDGSGSFDVNGDGLSYLWTIESAPGGSVAAFADLDAPITNLRLDINGNYLIGLQVEDEHSATSAKALYEFKFESTGGGDTSVFRHWFDETFTADPNASETFALGDLNAVDPLDRAITDFRFDVSGQPFPDTFTFTLWSTAYSVSTPDELIDVIEAFALNGDPNMTTRISPDPLMKDVTLFFGWGLGTLTLKNVLGSDLDRADVITAGAEFYQGTGTRHMPPTASLRFDQVPTDVSETIRLDPYDTSDIDAAPLNGVFTGLTIAPDGAWGSIGWADNQITPLTPSTAGDYVISLRAWDWAWSDVTSILIPATASADVRPVAAISPVIAAEVETLVPIDGSQSYDLNGDLLTWNWSLIRVPAGSTAVLSAADAPRIGFEPDEPGLYIIQLQVSGGGKTSKPVTMPIVVDNPLPYADAGRDQLVDFEGNAAVDSSASGPDVTGQRWKVVRITESSGDTVIDTPTAAETDVTVARRLSLFNSALNSGPVYHFADRPVDVGWCDYDIRRPDDVPGANPSEPVAISLTAQGEYWGTLGLSQVWEIENEGDYTRVVTLIDEDTTVYGSYTIPGGISLYVATPGTAAREVTAEVGGTPADTAYGASSPFSNGNLVCLGPAYDVLQVMVENAGGFSLPDTVFVGDANIRPILDRPADIPVSTGAALMLEGDDYSFDANGASLTFSWALLYRPTGSAALLDGQPVGTVIDAASVNLTPDVAGLYLVMLTARDSEFMSEPMVLVIEAGGSGNRPPVLEPLDPLYTVEAGLTLTIPLIGSDPDGDPISYFISPLPLPAGFTLDAVSGEIRFTPAAAQIGTYEFTVGVSDGALTDQATLNIDVTAATAGNTGVSGTVRDAVTNAPLSGIPVRLRDAALTTTTDVNGGFSFGSQTAGSDQVIVEPSASGGPGGYAGTVRSIRIAEEQEIPLTPDFLLMPLGEGCANVVAGNPTVLTGTSNGVTVTIPADSIEATGGGAYTGQVCLGSLPQLFVVEGMPEETLACRIYALDAPGAVFTEGVSVVAPNVDGLPETTVLDFWTINPVSGLFRPAAAAGVDTGATTVSTNAAGFRNSTLFTFLPRAPQLVSSADQPTGNRNYSVFDGNMSETYRLPAYRAFNRDQQVGLTYNSETANPTVIVAGDVTIRATDSLPVGLTTRIDLGGLSISDDAAWTPREGLDGSTPALVGEAVTLRQSLAVDALGLLSGRYGYNFTARAKYDCSTVSAVHSADIYIRNDSESPYGKGWVIEGLQELAIGEDGRATIFDDKGVSTFNPQPTLTEFDGDPLIFPTIGTVAVTVDDYDNDGFLDVAYGATGTGAIGIIRGLGGRDMVFEGETNFADPVTVPSTGTFTPNLLSVGSGDLSNGGSPDLGYGLQQQQRVGYLLNDGFGAFTDTSVPGSGTARVRDVAIVDMDRDGYNDFVYLDRGGLVTREVYAAYGGPGGLSPTVSLGSRAQSGVSLQLEIGDVDGNGLPDFAWRLSSGGTTFFFQTSPRVFTGVIPSPAIGPSPSTLLGKFFKFADFNGDGKLDVVWSGTDNITVYINANTTGRTFLAGVGLARPPGATTTMDVHAVDANGDGLPDIVASGDDTVAVYISNGDGTFQPFEEGFVDYPLLYVAFADIDGDGSLDMVSGQRFSVSVHFSKPSASGNFVAGAGEFSELTALPGGGWERRYKDGNVIVFDTDGRQTAEVDPQGNTRAFAYDGNGRLSTITDQVGGVTTFTYGLLGRLDTITYPDGRVTTFIYDDEAGALASITEPSPESGTVSFGYDENGRLISTTNQNGNTTGYSYDATGKLSGSNLPDGSSIRTQIGASIGLVDAFGSAAVPPLKFVKPEDRITIAVDRKGGETEIEVNEFGSIVRTTDPIGRETLVERDSNDLVAAITTPNEALPGGIRRDELTYDAKGNILTLVEAEGTSLERTTSYEYEPVFSKVTLMTDPGGFETEYEYDPTGLVLKITDAEGGERLFTYTAEGQIESRTDENDNETGFVYDLRGNLAEITYADGSVTALEYDAAGNLSVVAEASGQPEERLVVRTYDSLNRVLSLEITGPGGLPIGGTTTYAYDPAGNLTSVTDPTGLVTGMDYDSLERLVALDDPAEGLIRRTYNLAGEVIEHIDGDDEVQTFTYDTVSRLTGMTDAEGYVKAFAYDLRDNVDGVTDGRGNLTTFAYDGFDRMIGRTNPLDLTMERAYDSRDNLIELIREDGLIEAATYDDLGRRTGVTTPDNELTYGFDAVGNLILAEDNDSRITFTWDERNRLLTATTDGTVGPQPAVTLTYAYDGLDRRVSMADSLGGTTTYAWDVEDRLSTLTAPWGTVWTFGYDDEGRRLSLTSTTGRATTYGYVNGLLTALIHVQSAVTLTDLAYTYGPDGQLATMIDNLDPAKSQVYGYDAINRLLEVAEGVTPVPVEDYAYDQEGNRTASHLSAAYVSSDNNQILEDDSYTYAYDDRGNRISRTSKATSAVETYIYDSQNRLIGYETSATVATYAYDALDRRIAKSVDGVTETWVYDTDDLGDSTASNTALTFRAGALIKRWLFGPQVDEPLAYEAYSGTTTPGAGSVVELLANRLGSIVTAISVSTGAVAAEYDYQAYGIRTETAVLDQPYGFTAREHDAESGLIHFRARAYDPETGVFLQADPIGFGGGDENLFSYVRNDPINKSDPSGLTATMSYRLLAGAALVSGAQALCVIESACAEAASQLGESATRGIGSVFAAVVNLANAITHSMSQNPPVIINTPFGPTPTWSSTEQPDPFPPEPPEEPWWVKLLKLAEKIMSGAMGGE